jgi:hypothetical protein
MKTLALAALIAAATISTTQAQTSERVCTIYWGHGPVRDIHDNKNCINALLMHYSLGTVVTHKPIPEDEYRAAYTANILKRQADSRDFDRRWREQEKKNRDTFRRPCCK